MEWITLAIQTSGAAFEDEPATEVARILRELAERFEEYGHPQFRKLYDINGNACGTITVEPAA